MLVVSLLCLQYNWGIGQICCDWLVNNDPLQCNLKWALIELVGSISAHSNILVGLISIFYKTGQ